MLSGVRPKCLEPRSPLRPDYPTPGAIWDVSINCSRRSNRRRSHTLLARSSRSLCGHSRFEHTKQIFRSAKLARLISRNKEACGAQSSIPNRNLPRVVLHLRTRPDVNSGLGKHGYENFIQTDAAFKSWQFRRRAGQPAGRLIGADSSCRLACAAAMLGDTPTPWSPASVTSALAFIEGRALATAAAQPHF